MSGPRLVGLASAVILSFCLALLAVEGIGEDGFRAVIRLTARTSLVLFLLAFSASAAFRARRGPATRWLLANRRYVGVSFAASHAIHLAAIVTLLRVAPDFQINSATLIAGGLAYVFLAAMTATSFDRSAAWLGARRWRLLHKTGMYYCWFIFFISYAPRALMESPWYAPLVLVLLSALVLRWAAWRAR